MTIKSLEGKVIDQKKELDEKKDELEGLIDSKESLSSRLEAQFESSSQNIKSLENTLQETKTRLDDCEKTSAEAMELKLSEITSLESKWNVEVKMIKLDNSETQQRLIEAQQALQDDRERSSERSSKLCSELEFYQENLKALEEDYDNLLKSKQAASVEFHDAMADLEYRLDAGLNDLKVELDTKVLACADLTATLSKAKESLSAANVNVAAFQKECEILSATNNLKNDEIKSLNVEMKLKDDLLQGTFLL